MKSIFEYLTKDTFENRCGDIIFELDESSLYFLSPECRQMILEGNRVVWHDNDGNPLRMGDHATQRLDRPEEKGGDGEHIEEQEIVDMFRYAWDDIMDMYSEGYLQPTSDVNAFVIQCKCYLKPKGKKLFADGARPENKFLWAVFMVQENMKSGKIDIIIRTLFRGVRLNHANKQERIIIANNGFVKQKLPSNYEKF